MTLNRGNHTLTLNCWEQPALVALWCDSRREANMGIFDASEVRTPGALFGGGEAVKCCLQLLVGTFGLAISLQVKSWWNPPVGPPRRVVPLENSGLDQGWNVEPLGRPGSGIRFVVLCLTNCGLYPPCNSSDNMRKIEDSFRTSSEEENCWDSASGLTSREPGL